MSEAFICRNRKERARELKGEDRAAHLLETEVSVADRAMQNRGHPSEYRSPAQHVTGRVPLQKQQIEPKQRPEFNQNK